MLIGNQTVLPVGLICAYVKQIFDSEEMLHSVTVLGEVSNVKTVNGYVYFNLKDSDGVLPCVCFGLPRGELPKDGSKVYVNGSLSFYTKGGKLSFVVSKILYAGLGDIMLKYLETKNALEEQGLFSDRYKKPIPRYPKKVCVVTSVSGAVIKDIVRTIRNKNSIIDIAVVDVRVQGEDAPVDIVNGLKLADKTNSDVIVLARGGGSWEDLVPFCDERVARAVFDTKTPIITAIGHETDTTLVDYVSDMRASTPTGAGEYLAYSSEELKSRLNALLLDIKSATIKKYNDTSKAYINALNYVSLRADARHEYVNSKIKSLLMNIENGANKAFLDKKSKLEILLEKINASNPLQNLKKGLYKVSIEGKSVVEEVDFAVGKNVTIETKNLNIDAKITEIRGK